MDQSHTASQQHPVQPPAGSTVDYGRSAPARGPLIPMRMLVFIGVFALIFGYFGYLEVDLKSMVTFPFDQQHGTAQDIPERYRELDGKKVVLVGEMVAPSSATAQVGQFDLVYSIAQCCFTGSPQIQHFVKSTPSDGQPLPYYNGLVRATGTLKVNVVKDPDGKISGVFHLAVDSIDPV